MSPDFRKPDCIAAVMLRLGVPLFRLRQNNPTAGLPALGARRGGFLDEDALMERLVVGSENGAFVSWRGVRAGGWQDDLAA